MPDFSEKTRQTTLLYDHSNDLTLLCEKYKNKRSLFISCSGQTVKQTINSVIPIISVKEVNQFLGQELDCLIFDAVENFDVNAFAAIVGCLVGGGELILILPKALESTDQLLEFDILKQTEISPTLARLDFFIKQYQKENFASYPQDSLVKSNASSFKVEQQSLIERITRCGLGHARRPVIISAARGRGKSASIGIAIANIVFNHDKKIIVTAPSKKNTDILFQFVQKTLAQLLDSATTPTAEGVDKKTLSFYSNRITFYPIDKIIQEPLNCDLIVVDEAGAIPLQQLKTISQQFNRLIFATTTDGYEGNGGGFKIRFIPHLIKQFPQSRFTTINHPIRWAIYDPLEIAVNKALIQQAYPNEIQTNAIASQKMQPTIKAISKASYKTSKISQQKLWQQPEILTQVISLLISAHYQTRPSDLERILSDDKISVYIVLDKQTVIATALICEEGQFTREQCHHIEQGQLRLSGNILPQSMMAHQGIEQAGELKFWRVMRIATQQNYRRTSVGSHLIQHIFNEAANHDVDIFGASFAMENEVLDFWFKQSFNCSRIALRKDSSTGNLPCEILRLVNTKSSQAKRCVDKSYNLFSDLFEYNLSTSLKNADIESVERLFIQQLKQSSVAAKTLSSFQLKEIERFCQKARSFEMLVPQIQSFLKSTYSNGSLSNRILSNRQSINSGHILLRKAFCLNNWTSIVKEFDLKGKNEAKEIFRSAIETLLNNHHSNQKS